MEAPSRKNEPGSGVAVTVYTFVLLLTLNTPFTEAPVVPLQVEAQELVKKVSEKFVRAVPTLRSAAAAALSKADPAPYVSVRLGCVPESPDAPGSVIVRKAPAPLRLLRAPVNAPVTALKRSLPPETVILTSALLSENPANEVRLQPEIPVRTPLVKVAVPPVLTTTEMVLAVAGVERAAPNAAIVRNSLTFLIFTLIRSF